MGAPCDDPWAAGPLLRVYRERGMARPYGAADVAAARQQLRLVVDPDALPAAPWGEDADAALLRRALDAAEEVRLGAGVGLDGGEEPLSPDLSAAELYGACLDPLYARRVERLRASASASASAAALRWADGGENALVVLTRRLPAAEELWHGVGARLLHVASLAAAAGAAVVVVPADAGRELPAALRRERIDALRRLRLRVALPPVPLGDGSSRVAATAFVETVRAARPLLRVVVLASDWTARAAVAGLTAALDDFRAALRPAVPVSVVYDALPWAAHTPLEGCRFGAARGRRRFAPLPRDLAALRDAHIGLQLRADAVSASTAASAELLRNLVRVMPVHLAPLDAAAVIPQPPRAPLSAPPADVLVLAGAHPAGLASLVWFVRAFQHVDALCVRVAPLPPGAEALLAESGAPANWTVISDASPSTVLLQLAHARVAVVPGLLSADVELIALARAASVPVVTSPVGVDGVPFADCGVLVADSSGEAVDLVLRLLHDSVYWKSVSECAR